MLWKHCAKCSPHPVLPRFDNTRGGLQTVNVFDQLNRLTQTCIATNSPACSACTKLASYQYTLGPAGNRTNVLELNNRDVGYGYDNDYQLTSEQLRPILAATMGQ